MEMATPAEVRLRLLDLHKALVDAERRRYEKLHGRQTDNAFLEALVRDPQFAWLGRLTALIVRLDEALEEGAALEREWTAEIRRLVTPVGAEEFNRKYDELTQQVPEILVAHGAVMQALGSTR
jgi:hypothetical protein